MLNEKEFKYYISQKFVIEPSFWSKIDSTRLDEIETIADEDISKKNKLKSPDFFKNNEEYQVYLLSINNYAWADKLNAKVESSVTE